MTRMKRIRLRIAMKVARWLRVPLTPHQSYFAGDNFTTEGKSEKTVLS